MPTSDDSDDPADVGTRREADSHAHVRFFKLMEVAYNCANHDHYDFAARVAALAVDYYDSVDIEGARVMWEQSKDDSRRRGGDGS